MPYVRENFFAQIDAMNDTAQKMKFSFQDFFSKCDQRNNMKKSKEMSFEVTRANVSILNCVSITNISTEHYMEGVIK